MESLHDRTECCESRCNHRFEIVRQPHRAVREFLIELRCIECSSRKFVEVGPVTVKVFEPARCSHIRGDVGRIVQV